MRPHRFRESWRSLSQFGEPSASTAEKGMRKFPHPPGLALGCQARVQRESWRWPRRSWRPAAALEPVKTSHLDLSKPDLAASPCPELRSLGLLSWFGA